MSDQYRCRFCGAELNHVFADLGMSPLSNAYLTAAQLQGMEPFFPLRVLVCASCFLVQLPEVQSPEQIFSDYAYFSSYSESWLEHARRYVEQMTERFALNPSSLVVELASNDGYLLQYFVQRGVPVLGVEPAANVARVAQERGIPTVVRFFGRQTARDVIAEGRRANLLLGNNVLAHVPDLNDFVAGLKLLLADTGVITMEFPHLLQLMRLNLFDTIYHEHFSYFSLITVRRVFTAHGLTVFDVEEIPTHGGSLRIYAQHDAFASRPVSPAVSGLERKERAGGLEDMSSYASFSEQVRETKRRILSFLIGARRDRKQIVGYGAPAKGNTLLNYCGIRSDFLDYTVDRNPHKQGRFLPGTHIPVYAPERIAETRPDYVLILPWNLKDEIMSQMAHIRDWGGRFVLPLPRLEVVD
jgi:C-methyltransferase C-terminal domain/Putative zinc binding domain/Methyltransferase domain